MQKILLSFSQRAALLCLAMAVFNLHSVTVSGSFVVAPVPPTGELTMVGGVHVDDAPGISGQTFFSGSTFRVAAGSRSTLRLRNHSRLELSAETILKLDYSDDQITGTLKAGRLRVFAPSGSATRLMTADASVLADSRQPAIFSVESGSSGGTIISVELGQVELSFGSRKQLVSAGQFLSTHGGSENLPDERQNLSGGKRNVLLFGIAGVISMVILLLAGNGGDEESEPCFGGTITLVTPSTDTNPCR